MSIGEIEVYRIEPFFRNQKDLYESRLGFSLDYYKYFNKFNIVKLTTSDGLEYFRIESIVDVFVYFEELDYEHLADLGYIAEYFEQERNDPQEIVDMYNAEYGTNYSLFIRKYSREYQFIKDESLRERCREFATGIFIPRCLIIHYAAWVSNKFYWKIQQFVEKCEAGQIRKELDAKDSVIDKLSTELRKTIDGLDYVVKSYQESVSQLENIIQNYKFNINVLSGNVIPNEEE